MPDRPKLYCITCAKCDEHTREKTVETDRGVVVIIEGYLDRDCEEGNTKDLSAKGNENCGYSPKLPQVVFGSDSEIS